MKLFSFAETYQSQYLPQGNGLLIRNVSREDAGIFTCRANVELTAEFSEKRISLKVSIDFRITSFLSIKVVISLPNIYTYQSQYLPQQNGLFIRNVSREDAGIFTCRANVELTAEFSEKRISLKVKTYIQNELDHAKQRVQEKELDMY
ncbi:hypothetical protein QYM36_013450 [Artemia franciscana]|uniref:Immunoglobulin domain-containing protein n=1 Tax=Artemia franciscana TaxID=6661 RepID=A0AA88L226_ARTSF|nr:hypothetical protein QYM36_013450 [Artemia franciscana]